MNMNALINMILRQITRRAVNAGINAGINAASRRKKPGKRDASVTPEAPPMDRQRLAKQTRLTRKGPWT